MSKDKRQTSVQNAVEQTEAVEQKAELKLSGLTSLRIEHTIPQTRRIANPDPDPLRVKAQPKIDKPHPTLSKATVEQRRIYLKVTDPENLQGAKLLKSIEAQGRIGFGIAQDLFYDWDKLVGNGQELEVTVEELYGLSSKLTPEQRAANRAEKKRKETRLVEIQRMFKSNEISGEEAFKLLNSEKLI
ncbi:MAG: hypothetical protein MUP27_16260 [Desulfobacterales bacterium]|nr:hypothetical protein [Desulfobacterales bacterium]